MIRAYGYWMVCVSVAMLITYMEWMTYLFLMIGPVLMMVLAASFAICSAIIGELYYDWKEDREARLTRARARQPSASRRAERPTKGGGS